MCVFSHNFAPIALPQNIFFAVICQCKMINNLLWDSSECREYKLHFFCFSLFCFSFFIVYSALFPSPIWHSSCLTNIGAHKPWLLAPFAVCAYLMYYISSDINNDEDCVYDLMYLCIYYMAIKFFHCHSLSLSKLNFNTFMRPIDQFYLELWHHYNNIIICLRNLPENVG